MRIVLLGMILALHLACFAYADGYEPSYRVGGLGLGASVGGSSTAGASVTSSADLTYKTMGSGKETPGYTYVTHAVEVDGKYNMVGGSKDGVTTGIEGSATGFVGGTLLGKGAEGCNLYTGVAGTVSNGIHVNDPAKNNFNVSVSSEAGVLCQLDKVLLMMTPVAGVGYTGVWVPGTVNSEAVLPLPGGYEARADWLRVGARVRMAVKDKAYVSAEVLYAPSTGAPDSAKSPQWTMLSGKVIADYTVTPKSVVELYGKGVEYKDLSGNAPTAKGGEAGLTFISAF